MWTKEKLRLFLVFSGRDDYRQLLSAPIWDPEDRPGPGRIILELEGSGMPFRTLTLKRYDPEVTPDEYAETGRRHLLTCANPAICNDKDNRSTYPCECGVQLL